MKSNTVCWVLTGLQGFLANIQTDELLRTIQFIVAIVSAVVTLTYNIIQVVKAKSGTVQKDIWIERACNTLTDLALIIKNGSTYTEPKKKEEKKESENDGEQEQSNSLPDIKLY